MRELQVLPLLIIYTAAMMLIVMGKSDTATSRCAIFPRSAGDWLAFLFHTLELLIFNCMLFLFLGQAIMDKRVALVLLIALGASSVILGTSACVCWNYDRSLSKAGLIWVLIPVLLCLVLLALLASR